MINHHRPPPAEHGRLADRNSISSDFHNPSPGSTARRAVVNRGEDGYFKCPWCDLRERDARAMKVSHARATLS